MINVTRHACERFCERVAAVSLDEARAAILSHARAIESAIEFGAEVIRLAAETRLIVEGSSVVTVYARGILPRQCKSPFCHGEEEQPL